MLYPGLNLLLICAAILAALAISRSTGQSQAKGERGQAYNANTIVQPVIVKEKAEEMRRVIVTLRLEGYAATNEVAIAAVQNRVILAVSKMGATVERKYSNIPQLALSVTPQALAELRRNADVISIHEDLPQPPAR